MDEGELLKRITLNPAIFGGKPIVRGHRLAVEHVLGMLADGDTAAKIRDLAIRGWSRKTFRRVSSTYVALADSIPLNGRARAGQPLGGIAVEARNG